MPVKIVIIGLVGLVLLINNTPNAEEYEEVPTTITFDGVVEGSNMDGNYASVYSGSVVFNHQKHTDKAGIGCGQCHHDESFEPIDGFDPEQIYTCIDCHDEEGLIRGPNAENAISDDDLIAYRAHVLHMTCVGCHKQINNETKVIRAPESCITCHAQQPQNWVVSEDVQEGQRKQ